MTESKILKATVGLLLIAVIAAATSAGDSTPETGTLRGRVVDAETGRPLCHANVLLKGTTRGALTDSLGVFEFRLVGGEYTIQVLYLGYKPHKESVVVEPGELTTVEFPLETEIVETLDMIQVQGVNCMVEVKSAATELRFGGDRLQDYAIDSVEAAVTKQAGVQMRDGERYIRGDINSTAPPTMGAESGGTRNPNDRPYDLVYHKHYGVNPFVATEDDRLSTFALEVDDASWTIARRYLEDGHLPPAEAIRLEELVNRIAPGLPHAGEGDFSLHVDGAASRFGDGYHLVRIGVCARDIEDSARPPANLVFVIDTSSSMRRENRLGLVKRALRVLAGELREDDRVGIVEYGNSASRLLEPVGADEIGAILGTIDGLRPHGGTNAEAGLDLGYAMAREHAAAGVINRIILCSDGVANIGRTGHDSIFAAVRREADKGIYLTTIGFGMGNYNDVLMEQLADDGDGTYHYVHHLADAERVLRRNLTGTLQVVGADVMTQVEFDPDAVDRWRLLGYENRDVADEDFRDDTVDAGEIGAGHTAVALYEIKLTDEALRDRSRGRSRDLGVVSLRWAKPAHDDRAGEVTEIERRIGTRDLATTWHAASPHLRAAAVAAEFAEILRESYWARGSSLEDLAEPAQRLVSELPADGDVIELSQMIGRAAELEP